MSSMPSKQYGFATPAMFVAVLIAFAGSLGVKGKDGTRVAEAMGLYSGKSTEFAALEEEEKIDRIWIDE